MGCFFSDLCGTAEERRAWDLELKSRLKTFYSSASLKLHLNDFKDSPRLVVIDFFKWWPCQLPDIFINAMPHEFTDVEFIRIQVGIPDVAKEFQVHTMRTFVFFKKGKEVDRVVGVDIGELRNKIEKHRALQPSLC